METRSRPSLIIAGHQRTGTSAIAHLLARAAGKTLLDDPKWNYQVAMRPVYHDQSHLRQFVAENLATVEADFLKGPGCTLVAPLIRELLPSVRFLFSARDPRDTIAAVIEWRKARDLQQQDDWWDQRWLGIVAESKFECIALRWTKFYEIAMQVRPCTFVKYEDFCHDKIGCIHALCRQLSFPVINSLEGIVDIQFKKNFGDGKIRGPERWRGAFTQSELDLVREICWPVMQELGYEW